MSEPVPPHRALHLLIEGFPASDLKEILSSSLEESCTAEIFPLTEASASEALAKIFEADTVAVWSKL